MSSSNIHLPRHIFLSYSRKDQILVEGISDFLELEGVKFWKDDRNLEPGTPNWESSVRKAINESYALVLICTPNTPDSSYIQAEIQLAQARKCRIIPIWLDGDSWIDCVPFSLINYHYISFKVDILSGVETLVKLLSEKIIEIDKNQPRMFLVDSPAECPASFIPIVFNKQDKDSLSIQTIAEFKHGFDYQRIFPDNLQVLAVNPRAYEYFEELLHDLYTGFLKYRYRPYTYGQEWVLAKPCEYHLFMALPWQWLEHKRNVPLREVIPDNYERQTPIAEYGLGFQAAHSFRSEQIWAIVDESFERAFGVFTNNFKYVENVFGGEDKELHITFWHRKFSVNSGLNLLDAAKYTYKLVLSNLHRMHPDLERYLEEQVEGAIFEI